MIAFVNVARKKAFAALLALSFGICAGVLKADIAPFVGSYSGSAEVVTVGGDSRTRDMSVEIVGLDEGFRVSWTSVTYRGDGSAKEKSYTIDFVPSDRENVFAAAMKKNVFGHRVQLDPMQGEPYVWGQITGDTLTVYSMFVTETGGYELQEFDRTLAPGGLELEFRRVLDGEVLRTVSTFLEKQ